MATTRISRTAKLELGHLRNLGIVPSDEQILKICFLADIVDNGTTDLNILKCAGYKMGNIELFPLTLGAVTWVQDIVPDLFEDDPQMRDLCYAYASIHSRDKDAFELIDADIIRKRLKKEFRKILYTEEELANGLSKILPPDLNEMDNPIEVIDDLLHQISDPNITDINIERANRLSFANKENILKINEKQHISPIISILMKHYGNTIDYWLWEVDSGACMKMYNEAWKIQLKEKGIEIKKDDSDQGIKALKALKLYISKIIRDNKDIEE